MNDGDEVLAAVEQERYQQEKFPLEYVPEEPKKAPEPGSPEEIEQRCVPLFVKQAALKSKLADLDAREAAAKQLGATAPSANQEYRVWERNRNVLEANGLSLDSSERDQLQQEWSQTEAEINREAEEYRRVTQAQQQPLPPDYSQYDEQPQYEQPPYQPAPAVADAAFMQQAQALINSRPDAEQVIAQSMKVPISALSPDLQNAIVEVGPHALVAVMANPGAIFELNTMNRSQAAIALNSLAAQADNDEPQRPRPPKPPTPTGRNPTRTTRSIYDEDIPYKEFVKLRESGHGR